MNYSLISQAKRSSKRITITIPHHVFDAVTAASDLQGRSFSNLAAYLLERSLQFLPQLDP